jgi:hypothetical protein
MTWQEAKHEAAIRARAIEAVARAQQPLPDFIPLSDYPDETTFNFLVPNAGWQFPEYRVVNNAVARLLRKRGWNVILVPIRLQEYFDWLAEFKRENTPNARAQFVGEVALEKVLH